MFLFSNEGYASIRMTQRNYFDGGYLGCDTKTGLGFPDWPDAVRRPTASRSSRSTSSWASSADSARSSRPTDRPAFVVPIDPEQTYFPEDHEPGHGDGEHGIEPAPPHVARRRA